MSRARKKRDWAEQIRLAIDPELAREIRARTCREDPRHAPCVGICARTKPMPPSDSRHTQGACFRGDVRVAYERRTLQ